MPSVAPSDLKIHFLVESPDDSLLRSLDKECNFTNFSFESFERVCALSSRLEVISF